MRSQAEDVDRYLEEVPAGRQEALKKLRDLVVATLAGYTETMKYGMPSYARDGTVEVAFASQKNYISLYIMKEEVLNRHRPALQELNLGKGCIRYAKPEKIDFEVVKGLLVDTFESDADAC